MIKIILLFIVGHFYLLPHAQVSNSHINNLRYNDDFRYLNNDTTKKKGYEHLKMIRFFGKDTNHTISFGATSRQVYQYYKNESFNTLPANSKDGFLWNRFLLHSDVDLGKHLRVFTQLNSALVFGKKGGPRRVTDKNALALHQAFIDIKTGDTTSQFKLRLGRQEIELPNSFLLTVREIPNQRLAFDAARFIYSRKNRWNLNVLFGQAIDYGFGVFDDRWQRGQYLFAANIQHGNQKTVLVDFIYVASHNGQIELAGITGVDKRHTIGLTIMGQKENFYFEAAGYYQFGRFKEKKISAYTDFALARYTFSKAKLQPYVSIVVSAISGDQNHLGNKMNTFNVLYSRPYYAQSNPLGRTNNNTLEANAGITLPRKINTKIVAKVIWRNSIKDGLYNPGGLLIFPKGPINQPLVSEKHVGTSFDWEASIPINQHMTFVFNGEHLIAGSYLKKINNGKSITFFASTLHFAL